MPAHDLGAVAIKAALERAKVEPGEVDEVILGQVLTAAPGPEPGPPGGDQGRHSRRKTAFGINQVCGSACAPWRSAAQQIATGDAEIVVAGGQESMTLAPHAAHLRAGTKMGDLKFVDTMIKDGLWDAFNGYHMGITAENVAAKWQITREEQDEFAVASQNKAEAAQKAGRFKDEIVPVTRQEPQGRRGRRRRRIHPRTARRSSASPSCGRPSTRTAR